MDASAAAIVGAAVGAVSGLGGGWLSVMGQARQHRRRRVDERERWREELRREAYSTFIAAAKQLSAAWWRVNDRLEAPGSSIVEWRDHFAEAHAAWVDFSTAAAVVAVAGPRAVADAADHLRSAMSDWEAVGMAWIQEASSDDVERLAHLKGKFNELAQAKRVPDRVFQELARQALGTDD